ncbi:MarR family winged helix-turn-helix transcriptional regulator [Fodinibius sediminis]|uniref:DNA-binding transcriptional regulator, MarR family n=1 Tax=Fodinibius sediminis TaxID=1214077 RepID=A0A521AD47_9BACT|nr:MarR family transcriptional regulator [Fodinibius sediminis]SMO32743.1 DNA-binding transcriptional regulator, MarR family [Fodinibius sediminis]
MPDIHDEMLSGNLIFLTSALSRQLSREADEAFAAVGLSTSHALLLMLAQRNPGIQPGSLAEALSLKPSTITRLVQKIERRGLVWRKSKGRATAVICTEEGEKLAEQLEETWERVLNQIKEQLGERYVEVLSEMIEKAMEELV